MLYLAELPARLMFNFRIGEENINQRMGHLHLLRPGTHPIKTGQSQIVSPAARKSNRCYTLPHFPARGIETVHSVSVIDGRARIADRVMPDQETGGRGEGAERERQYIG